MKLRNIALSLLAAASMASAQAADYSVQFDTSFTASAHPEVSIHGLPAADGMYFVEGYGVNLSNVLTSSVYTIDTRFSFDVTQYSRKVIDFGDRSSDNGLYETDGRLSFYADGLSTDGITNSFADGQEVRLTLTRSASNIFTAYLNGVQEFSFDDTAGNTLFSGPNSIARFFMDDLVTSGYERSPGTVRYIQVFDQALSAGDVLTLSGPSPVGMVPEPESMALALAGLLAVGTLMKRRRA